MTDAERVILNMGCDLETEVKLLKRENAELNEMIDDNLRVHKAAEKADAERIWKLQEENDSLRRRIEVLEKGEEVMGDAPCCSEKEYVVSYRWLDGRGTVVAARFKERSHAIRYIGEHVDDNVNLEWVIRKGDA